MPYSRSKNARIARVYRPPISPSILGKPRRSSRGTIPRHSVYRPGPISATEISISLAKSGRSSRVTCRRWRSLIVSPFSRRCLACSRKVEFRIDLSIASCSSGDRSGRPDWGGFEVKSVYRRAARANAVAATNTATVMGPAVRMPAGVRRPRRRKGWPMRRSKPARISLGWVAGVSMSDAVIR